MRRKYLDRIEFYSGTATADGVGGNTLTDALLGACWANVTTIPTNKLVDVGLDLEQNAIRVMTRTRSDINIHTNGVYILYKSKEFTITSITEVDLNGKEVEIIATWLKQ